MNREVISDWWHIVSNILKQSAKGTNACYGCGNSAITMLCNSCLSQIERFDCTEASEEHFALNKRSDFKQAIPLLQPYKLVIVGPHQGLLKQCISAFKYHNTPALAEDLAMLFTREVTHHYCNGPLPDAIVPMPVHPWKLARRGYNQTILLGEALRRTLDIPLLSNLLISTRLNKAQVSKNGKARRKLADRNIMVNQALSLKGIQHVALLDDVITTGSTMLTLVRALEAVNPELRIDLWSLTISLRR